MYVVVTVVVQHRPTGVLSVPLSVLDMLDGMKKEKGNFAARDAIKFLEREFQQKNRFVLIDFCI